MRVGVAGKKHAGITEERVSMKSREGLIRLKRFQVDEKRRQVAQIETMIAEFERMAKDLNDQVVAEQERSGIHDTSHFAYPTFAKAAMQRRDNLLASTHELREQLATAQAECAEAIEELEKYEAIAERDQDRHSERTPDPAARDAGPTTARNASAFLR
jgi:flagellar export protein FliJ